MKSHHMNAIWKFFSILLIILVVGTSQGGVKGASKSVSTSGFNSENVAQNPQAGLKVFLPFVTTNRPLSPFGIYLDAQTPDTGLAQVKGTNMSWIHPNLWWAAVEAQQGQRNWAAATRLENILRSAANSQITTILYLQGTPEWARKPGIACAGTVATDKLSALASFLTDLVTRYSAPPFNVKYYELWSEEEVAGGMGCWGDSSDTNFYGGGAYGEMLKVAYPAIKAASPSAQVLFGGLLMDCKPDICNSPDKKSMARFLDGALAVGAGNSFDGISFHVYDYYQNSLGQYFNPNWGSAWNTTGSALLLKTAYLRQVLAQYNVTGKYLVNTEIAMVCGSTGTEPYCLTQEHQDTLASYLVQTYSHGLMDGLQTIIWFSATGWRGSGLLDSNLNPLPVYNTYKNANSRLGTTIYTRTITDFAGIQGYEFTRAGHRIWVLWSVTSDGNPHTINLGATPIAAYDLYGNPLAPSATFSIGLKPVFVEFGS